MKENQSCNIFKKFISKKNKKKKNIELLKTYILQQTIESYYNDLDNLAKRLQADYAGGEDHIPFEQFEEDRIALCAILDIFDEIKENVLNKKMTNREYLNSLTNEEFVNFIFYDFQIISRQYTQSTTGMLDWLEQEHKE